MNNSKHLRYWIAIFLLVVILTISGCGSQTSQESSQSAAQEQARPPTVTRGCPSVYDGTYQGIFTYDYEVFEDGEVVRTGTDGVRVSLTLKCRAVDEQNEWVELDATNVIASHPYFGCQVGGCVPLDYNDISTNVYEALLPLNPPTTVNEPSKIGEGISIYFPDGAWLITTNAEGDLHVGFNGQTLSNSLTGGNTWAAGKQMPTIDPFPGTDESGEYVSVKNYKSWILSKTT